jgi:putative radical SAM enzyme (TIGR03279 family)
VSVDPLPSRHGGYAPTHGDYAPTHGGYAPTHRSPTARREAPEALIAHVDETSPAARAGLAPGMIITAVEDEPLGDIIDWLWLADGAAVRLTARLADQTRDFALTRAYGESWGIRFADPLFDGLMTCRNSCVFCFMTMLPKGMRPSLYDRDDDYRLSFLQGNFVTLTNLDERDVVRVIERHVSPLHVSLHAITPAIRKRLMGKNHARGVEVLDRLLRSGIEAHVQLVLMPNVNDGAELNATLAWIERRPNVLSAGIVPYGFTRYARVRESFDREGARDLIAQLAPWQERSRERDGTTRFQLADEWYLLAETPCPPAAHYDGYPQFEDGIGMLRFFEDAWEQGISARETEGAHGVDPEIFLVTGEGFAPELERLVNKSFPDGATKVVAVRNHFFGSSIRVAGLLTAQDIITQLKTRHLPKESLVVLPDALFNADGLTLDNKTTDDIARALRRRIVVIPCMAEKVLHLIEGRKEHF